MCANGKDPLCSCSLPDSVTSSYAFAGPSDAGDGGTGDGGTWTCDDECTTYHRNGNGTLTSCSLAPSIAPQNVTCTYYVKCIGRRPAELAEPVLESTDAGELLSTTAKLEEASIHAFVRLARELAHHRAPAALVARAREAADDEVRHARAMHALAVKYGADATSSPRSRPHVRRVPRLVDVLVENAVEGCVRETFGALMAHVQALRATDPVVRSTMARVAIDESRHAALAWAIDEWGSARVSPADRRRIAAARQDATRALMSEIDRGPRNVDEPELGLIGAAEARVLAVSLDGLAATNPCVDAAA